MTTTQPVIDKSSAKGPVDLWSLPGRIAAKRDQRREGRARS